MKSTDKIVTITVKEQDMASDNEMKDYIMNECKKFNVTKYEAVLLDPEPHRNTY